MCLMKIQLVHMNDSHSQLHETITRVYVWNRQLKISVFFSYGRLFGLLLEWKIPMNTLKANFKVQSNWSWTIRNNACRRALQVRTRESFHNSWLMNYRSHTWHLYEWESAQPFYSILHHVQKSHTIYSNAMRCPLSIG